MPASHPSFDHVAIVTPRGQDRASVHVHGDRLVVALADGAGGTTNGEVAAQAIVDAVAATGVAADWAAFLADLDATLAGQSTAVVLTLSVDGIVGASVGDSGAWLIAGSSVIDLTDGQMRKPLVGAGCEPFSVFAAPLGERTLLVASDGLLRYAAPADIARIASGPDLHAAAHALVELVRLPSGGFQDDVSVVLCRQ